MQGDQTSLPFRGLLIVGLFLLSVVLHVDVTIENGRFCIGVVARSSYGIVLHLRTVEELIRNVEAAEAKAILVALQLALQKQWTNICVEGTIRSLALPSSSTLNHWESSCYMQDCLSKSFLSYLFFSLGF